MTKYKAGDLVTIRLFMEDAVDFNTDRLAKIPSRQIIKHEPAPDPKPPVVIYCNAYDDHFGNLLTEAIDCDTLSNGRLAILKLTWNPDTRTVSAEVVG